MTGEKEGTIDIDLNRIYESDRQKNSSYIVAGRAYFEAHIFGHRITSFTSGGFLEQ